MELTDKQPAPKPESKKQELPFDLGQAAAFVLGGLAGVAYFTGAIYMLSSTLL